MSPEHEREFREFVAARSAALLRSAYLLTGDEHRAQDLLQAALLATALRWAKINDRDRRETYVRRALYHQEISAWRRRSRRPEALTAAPPERDAGTDHAATTVLRHELIGALRTLPPGQRAVVVLRYYEDRPEAEVAQVLGVSVGTVRSQAAKALAKLRTRFPDLGEESAPERARGRT